MDSIREQLVQRPHSPDENAKKIIIIIAVTAAMILIVLLALATGNLLITELGIFAAIALPFLGWWLIGRFNVEYEYDIYGSDMRIDKIYNKRSRKTMAEFDLKKAEAFYDSERVPDDASAVSACGEGKKYTLIFNHPTLGKTALVFTPDEKTLDVIKPYLPRLS